MKIYEIEDRIFKEIRYMKARLIDESLVDRSKIITFSGRRSLAVPVGGHRKLGIFEFQFATGTDEFWSDDVVLQLQKWPALYPNAKVYPSTFEPVRSHGILYGGQNVIDMYRSLPKNDMVKYHRIVGNLLGYKPEIINEFLKKYED